MQLWDVLVFQLGYRFLCWLWDLQAESRCSGLRSSVSIVSNHRWIAHSFTVWKWIHTPVPRRGSQSLHRDDKENGFFQPLSTLWSSSSTPWRTKITSALPGRKWLHFWWPWDSAIQEESGIPAFLGLPTCREETQLLLPRCYDVVLKASPLLSNVWWKTA